MNPTNLRCEYLKNPLGIDIAKPRLSWELVSEKRGESQTAYRILVASSMEILNEDRGDIWDSGRVESDRTYGIEYRGNPLAIPQNSADCISSLLQIVGNIKCLILYPLAVIGPFRSKAMIADPFAVYVNLVEAEC